MFPELRHLAKIRTYVFLRNYSILTLKWDLQTLFDDLAMTL